MEKSQMDEEEFSKHVNNKNYTRVYKEKKNEVEQNKTTTRTAAFDLEQVLLSPCGPTVYTILKAPSKS